MFSSRIAFDLTPNPLAAALERVRATGAVVDDLTESNPTRAGLPYPADILAPLSDAASVRYQPAALGMASARAAVAGDHARQGVAVSPERVVITASTSESYSVLFKLLCDPGDEVLVPAPSYPLFEYLAALESVRVQHYQLEYHGRWSMDVHSVESALGPRTRAIVIVSPNNPTGSYLDREQLDALVALARARGLALICDEVFAEYTLDARPGGLPGSGPVSVLAQREVLAFALGGLSKSIGMPQLKLGWMVVTGPDALVEEALGRLELICDTYLSVATPVQHALPALLDRGAVIRTAILERIRRNLGALRAAAVSYPAATVLPVEGGWYATIRVPATQSEEALVLELLEREHVLVHPGFFFDFPREAFLVLSLLTHPEVFDRAIVRVLARAAPPDRER